MFPLEMWHEYQKWCPFSVTLKCRFDACCLMCTEPKLQYSQLWCCPHSNYCPLETQGSLSSIDPNLPRGKSPTWLKVEHTSVWGWPLLIRGQEYLVQVLVMQFVELSDGSHHYSLITGNFHFELCCLKSQNKQRSKYSKVLFNVWTVTDNPSVAHNESISFEQSSHCHEVKTTYKSMTSWINTILVQANRLHQSLLQVGRGYNHVSVHAVFLQSKIVLAPASSFVGAGYDPEPAFLTLGGWG